MISILYAAIAAAMPAAMAVLPAFVAMPISAIMVKLALRALPYPEGPRETIELAADKVQNLGLAGVALFFCTLFAATNMAAFEAQRSFGASIDQLHR